MEEPTKGTVTPFASMFPFDEAQKAVKRVEDAIAEKQKELDHLKQFIADNTNLINLVSCLPDELHHDVMVPFGKAAFFPGRLIHTNEFRVLLGEGYYADRTAKQTIEILKRRGKALDSQAESLKANIKDLRAEASFFGSTAAEAAEGLVEIREDYVEKSSSADQSKSEKGDNKVTIEDDEYAHIMSRLDELEKEELAAEGENDSDEDEHTYTADSDNESGEDECIDIVEGDNESGEDAQINAAKRDSDGHEYNQTEANFNNFASQTSLKTRKTQKQTEVKNLSVEALSNKFHNQLDTTDQPNCTGLTVQPVPKDDMSNRKHPTRIEKSIPDEKDLLLPGVKKKVEAASSSRNECFTGPIEECSSITEENSQNQTVTSSQTPVRASSPAFDSSKAFTGSIVERVDNVPTSQERSATSSQSPNSQPSKPVSRFKMQRR
ncbi:hypothetical protein MANES_13G144900v8 [Manihot esculenta]|uniref:RNA polymerase II subunit 5-mediating protein homolog n=1 Tax=Manihot esculenta TaxID=3983 RepID=A0A2C9URM4_MANES|nr:hypothetical protein MANES_13G144900v8 [Manihot esculenta]